MKSAESPLSLEAILADQTEPTESNSSPFSHWPTISAEALALAGIRDCEQQILLSISDPLRLAQAAKSAHHALQSALTAALAGSMGIGAYDAKLERKWLAALQDGGPWPDSNRVMEFSMLLSKARNGPLEWTNAPLEVSDAEEELLDKLTLIRHGLEHPKPGVWVIEPAYILGVIPVAIRLTLTLIEGLQHHFEIEQLTAARTSATEIEETCLRLSGRSGRPA